MNSSYTCFRFIEYKYNYVSEPFFYYEQALEAAKAYCRKHDTSLSVVIVEEIADVDAVIETKVYKRLVF